MLSHGAGILGFMAHTKKPAPSDAVIAARLGLVKAIIIANLVSLGLLLVRFTASGVYRYWFLLWNLFLGALPVLFIWAWRRNLRLRPVGHWTSLLLLVLWLGFLPNSFYLLSDFIHLYYTPESTLLYDTVLLASFAANGLIFGFASLLIVHREALRQLRARWIHIVITMVLALCSFAIHLGRDLRWNTWDVLISPAGLIFDVSDRIINPGSYPSAFTTTLTFFCLLGSFYLVVYRGVIYLRALPK